MLALRKVCYFDTEVCCGTFVYCVKMYFFDWFDKELNNQ